jgi:hypothetical protein
MSQSIYSGLTVEGEDELNGELRRRGIPHTVGELLHNPALRPDCGGDLLDLFRSAVPFNVRTALAGAVFARKLKPAQKRQAFATLRALIKDNPEKSCSLSMLVWNELPNNVDPTKVHELGQMTLDQKYGPLRSGFIMALKKIRNATAVGYLLRAARDPLTAVYALDQLARLRVPGTLQLCDEALALPGVIHTDAIRATRTKLKRCE